MAACSALLESRLETIRRPERISNWRLTFQPGTDAALQTRHRRRQGARGSVEGLRPCHRSARLRVRAPEVRDTTNSSPDLPMASPRPRWRNRDVRPVGIRPQRVHRPPRAREARRPPQRLEPPSTSVVAVASCPRPREGTAEVLPPGARRRARARDLRAETQRPRHLAPQPYVMSSGIRAPLSIAPFDDLRSRAAAGWKHLASSAGSRRCGEAPPDRRDGRPALVGCISRSVIPGSSDQRRYGAAGMRRAVRGTCAVLRARKLARRRRLSSPASRARSRARQRPEPPANSDSSRVSSS